MHAAAHAYNFPRTKIICADAASLSEARLRTAAEEGARAYGHEMADVDVVFGGPPCQGFSAGGKRNRGDQRNLLLFDFARLTLALRPRYFVLENVPPLKNHPDADCPAEKLLDRLIAVFEKAGYTCLTPQILQASRYGVPQDRRRLIVIGTDRGASEPKFPPTIVTPLPKVPGAKPRSWEVGGGSIDASLPRGPNVDEAISDLPDPDAFDELLSDDCVTLSVEQFLDLERRASAYARLLRGMDLDQHDLSYPRKWDRTILTCSRRTVHRDDTVRRFSATAMGKSESSSRYFRLHPDGLCSTLRAGTGYELGSFMAPRPIHPEQARVITVREAARLHSFPDWFRFHYSKWHGFRQIGNSLPPLLGRAIAAQLVGALDVPIGRPAEVGALGDPQLLKMTTSEAVEHFAADRKSVPTHKLRSRPARRSRARENDQLAA